MGNERTTEDLVREHIKQSPATGQIVEEQTSSDPAIRSALAAASKSGAGGGKPEFIVRLPDYPGLVVVVECKANRKFHASAAKDKPATYAVDGVLHYMRHLSRHFDVVGIAVSGTRSDDLLISTFRQLRGALEPEVLESEDGPVDKLVAVPDYGRLLTFDPAVRARTQAELMAFSRELHHFMRNKAKVAENEKPLVVSGILLALRDDVFKKSWRVYKPKDLGRELYAALEREVEAADIRQPKQKVMMAPYSFFETHPELTKPGRNGEEPPLRQLIADIDEHVRPFIDTYHDVDVIGQFYGEFLRYTGGDKKGLGIVLTPRHLTQLFVRIANVGPSDTVVDTCAGTGGFLIASMAHMDAQVPNDAAAQDRIRKHQLVGAEQQPHMFALAASNMILRGDGKANLYQGDSFTNPIRDALRKGVAKRHERPNVGLINPPFSQGEGQHELEFAEALLEYLTPGGTAVVVAPMSCALEPHPARRRLLAKHTLVAVMSLPNDIFHPVGVITCAMVFRAHQPHASSRQDTWFGYWKDDGFVKTKDRGRIDLNGRWDAIADHWIDSFHNRRVVPGESVTRKVTADDEWCAEAYMETDYSQITKSDFEQTLREFAVFHLLLGEEATT